MLRTGRICSLIAPRATRVVVVIVVIVVIVVVVIVVVVIVAAATNVSTRLVFVGK